MPFHPARRASLPEVVLDQILGQIRDDSIQPGERLPTEAELARTLQVGRSSVREALRVLVVMRVIETRPRRGAYILRKPEGLLYGDRSTLGAAAHLERMAMRDLYDVREAIEGRVAELAAERATTRDIQEIERCAAAVEAQVSESKTYFRSNMDFHVAIAKASQNHFFVECLRDLLSQLRSFNEHLMAEEAPMRERDIAEHRALLEAIKAGKGKLARKLAVGHIMNSREIASQFGVSGAVALMQDCKPSIRTKVAPSRQDGTLGGGNPGRTGPRNKLGGTL